MQILQGTFGTDPRTADGRSLPRLLRDRCRTHATQIAMRRKHRGIWQGWTWNQVLTTVRALAAGLAGQGLGRGHTIAAISENIVELYWIEYAALCAGARVVCLYPDASAEELRFALDHSEARLLIAEDQEQVDKSLLVAETLPELARIVFVDGAGLWHETEPRLLSFAALLADGQRRDAADPGAFDRAVDMVQPDDVAVLCYTSGTTGLPKAGMLTHRYLLENAYRLMAAFGLRPGAEYLSYISPAWAAEQMTGLALGILAPLTVAFAEKPETVRADLRELAPEFLLFTPRQWEMLAAEAEARMLDAPRWRQALFHWAVRSGEQRGEQRGALGSARLWLADRLVLAGIRDNLGLPRTVAALSGGAGMSAQMFRLFRAFGVPLSNIYGSTELGLIAAHWGSGQDAGTMGRLLPSDPGGAAQLVVGLADTGELLLQHGGLFGGYWRDAAATAALSDGDMLHTGDAVRMRPDGQLVYLDRMKDIRRLADGTPFPPQFIENHLRASPFVKDAMVIGDERRGFVTALVNINAGIAGRFAERHGLAFASFAELSQLPDIRNRVGELVAEVNARLEPAARVRRFATLPKELDPDEAELTRSRKLRRDRIEESFSDIIAALYDDARECEARVRVRYRDGQNSVLVARVALNDVPAAPAAVP